MKKTSAFFFTHPIGILLTAIACTFLWGSAFPAIKIGYELFSIGEEDVFGKICFAGYRFLLAGIITLVIGSLSQKRLLLVKRENIKGVALLGIVQTSLQYLFFYIGLSHTTGVKGSILNSSGAFLAVVFAHFSRQNDKMNLSKTIGCLLGFSGVILANFDGSALGGGFRLEGEGLMFGSAVCFALGALISRNVAGKENTFSITGWQLSFGGIILVAAGIVGGGNISIPGVKALILFAYLVLLSAAAFVLWTTLLKYNPVGKVSVYNFLIPVFGTFLSVVLLGETAHWSLFAALLLVCVGIFIVNRPQKLLSVFQKNEDTQ